MWNNPFYNNHYNDVEIALDMELGVKVKHEVFQPFIKTMSEFYESIFGEWMIWMVEDLEEEMDMKIEDLEEEMDI